MSNNLTISGLSSYIEDSIALVRIYLALSQDNSTVAFLTPTASGGQNKTFAATIDADAGTLTLKGAPLDVSVETSGVANADSRWDWVSLSSDGNILVTSRRGGGPDHSQIAIYEYNSGTNTWDPKGSAPGNAIWLSSTVFGSNIVWGATKINPAGTRIYGKRTDGSGMAIMGWDGTTLSSINIQALPGLSGSNNALSELNMSRNCHYVIMSQFSSGGDIFVYEDVNEDDTWTQVGPTIVGSTFFPVSDAGAAYTEIGRTSAITSDGSRMLISLRRTTAPVLEDVAVVDYNSGTNTWVYNTTIQLLTAPYFGVGSTHDLGDYSAMQISESGTVFTVGDEFNGGISTTGLSDNFTYIEETTPGTWVAREPLSGVVPPNPPFGASAVVTPANYNFIIDSDASFVIAPVNITDSSLPNEVVALFSKQAPTAVADAVGPFSAGVNNTIIVGSNDTPNNNINATIEIVDADGIAGITTDVSTGVVTDGSITIPSSASSGSYTVQYRWVTSSGKTGNTVNLDFTLNPTFTPITLNTDALGSINSATGGTFAVLTNDDLGGRNSTTDVTVQITTNIPGGSPVTVSSNQVVIPTGLADGAYNFDYDVVDNADTMALTGSPANVTFTITGAITAITLNDDTIGEVDFTGQTVDVLTNDDLGGRNTTTDVTVQITTNIPGGSPVTVSSNQLVIPSGLDIGNYTLQYDVLDNVDTMALTGSPATVTFNISATATGGTFPTNPSGFVSFGSSGGVGGNIFVVSAGDKAAILQAYNAVYTGNSASEASAIIERILPRLIRAGKAINNGETGKVISYQTQEGTIEIIF